MRLEQVSFKGYRRLVDTSFYVNRRLVAIVGPNEAGKSSILNAMLTLESTDPITDPERSRTVDRYDEVPIVSAVYRYDAKDHEALASIPLFAPPKTVTRSKRSDGTVDIVFDPPLQFKYPLFSDARTALVELIAAVQKLPSTLDFVFTAPDGVVRDHAQIMEQALANWPNAGTRPTITSEEWESIWEVESRWDDYNGTQGNKKRWASLTRYYDEVEAQSDLRQRVLAMRPVPTFEIFRESDRTLRNEYDLAQYDSPDDLPPPLRNLLDFAELEFSALQRAFTDEALGEGIIGPANERITQKFASRWKQSKVAVYLKLNGSVLKVFVEDVATKAKALFSERSDGLRMFVALMLFLERRITATPPILLIDEADIHLHLDAQADLISILTKFMAVAQVVYTTHSPGCLPPDLGTGVRFLEPRETPPGSSSIVPFFWSKASSEREAGLLPLLFMLGARSAAFSRLRNAVVVEGQTEALLMPSLIREANGLEELDYQIVPGLSEASIVDFEELSEVAVRVLYLVDGDKGGDALRLWLKERKVVAPQVQQLSKGTAIEDLLDPHTYAAAVNKLLPSTTPFAPTVGAGLVKDQAVTWAKAQGLRMVGPVIVAEMILTLVESHELELQLRPGATKDLARIHGALLAQFNKSVTN